MTLADHIIETGRNGDLSGDTTEETIKAIVDRVAGGSHVVLHFHGGLVSRENGLKVAANLLPVYDAAGADPVFFVWQSGLLETLEHNVSEILTEDLMRTALVKVTKFVLAKFGQDDGARTAGGLTPERESVVYSRLRPVLKPAIDLPAAPELDDYRSATTELSDAESAGDRGRTEPRCRSRPRHRPGPRRSSSGAGRDRVAVGWPGPRLHDVAHRSVGPERTRG